MSRRVVGQAPPSWLSEQLLGLWIWGRHKLNPKLERETASIVAEGNLAHVRANINKNYEKLLGEVQKEQHALHMKMHSAKQLPGRDAKLQQMRRLLPALKRLKRAQNQAHMVEKQLGVLDVQINAFETGRFQKEMAETLRSSISVLRKNGISEDDVSKMDDMVGDVEESMNLQNELSETLNSVNNVAAEDAAGAFAGNGTASMADEALLRELLSLAGAENLLEAEEAVVETDMQNHSTEHVDPVDHSGGMGGGGGGTSVLEKQPPKAEEQSGHSTEDPPEQSAAPAPASPVHEEEEEEEEKEEGALVATGVF